ncbi:flagellar motor switch protein FliG [Algisphaera agarilytica]|uniref:Flagellar motor switch protein FliG n=1 Tax=Algisphaera agarilytica TaxID=1385975 RepID=A0A7X0H7J1_9BACT|nr:flagellar motor switch protein FliG [Algisphaera agarilytica]MBB6430737.1 flagellar motor switch protein FliG [Algisphaera agarilytica]
MFKSIKPTDTIDDLSGVRKAAVLLLALDGEASGMVLKTMPTQAVEEVTRELASIGSVPPRLRDEVVTEFYNLAVSQSWAVEGGLENARMLLANSLSKEDADAIMQRISHQVRKTPFAFLQKAESSNLLTFIQDEHPQTIALIVSHLQYAKASEILGGLPTAKQIEVVKRVANMEQTNPEVISEVEKGLEARLANMLNQSFEKLGGINSVAEMLNLTDRTTEKSIMEGLEADDPDLVEEIRRLMFVFEDINLVDDKGIQAVLKEVENDELSLALKTASQDLQDKIFRNMSERAATLIAEDMEFMGPVRVSDVEAAQQRIVDIVRRLEDAGEIIISGRGGDKDLVV